MTIYGTLAKTSTKAAPEAVVGVEEKSEEAANQSASSQ